MKDFSINDVLSIYEKELSNFIKSKEDIFKSTLAKVKIETDEDYNFIFIYKGLNNEEECFFVLESTYFDGTPFYYENFDKLRVDAINFKKDFDFEEEPILFNSIHYFGLCSNIKEVFVFVHATIEIYLKYKQLPKSMLPNNEKIEKELRDHFKQSCLVLLNIKK